MKEVTLTLRRGPLYFSSGHFTVFTKSERECLHGHNYYVEAEFTAVESEPGLLCDYAVLKKKIKSICEPLHCKFILAAKSPHAKIEIKGKNLFVHFNGEVIPFLKSDIVLLPVTNTSLEDLSRYFLQEVLNDTQFVEQYKFSRIEIKIFNGNEQSATATFSKQTQSRFV